MTLTLRDAFEGELRDGRACRQAGDLDAAFRHCERAHILGQRHTFAHVRAHVAMLGIGVARRDVREIAGQLQRIVAALVFSGLWIPVGNTGGASVSAFAPMVIPADLSAILAADAAAAAGTAPPASKTYRATKGQNP